MPRAFVVGEAIIFASIIGSLPKLAATDPPPGRSALKVLPRLRRKCWVLNTAENWDVPIFTCSYRTGEQANFAAAMINKALERAISVDKA